MSKEIIILSCKNGIQIGRQLHRKLKSGIKNIEIEEIVDSKFANDETNIELKSDIRGKTVLVVQDVTNTNESSSLNDNIFSALLTAQVAKLNGAKEIHFILPYLPYSRQDRLTEIKKEPLSLRYFIKIIELLDPKTIFSIDIHSSGYALAADEARIFSITAEEIMTQNNILPADVVLCPTDFNGTKNIIKYASKFNLEYVVVGKIRDQKSINKVTKSFILGDVKNKDVLIIDDMIDTGGTILSLLENLKKEGARSVQIYASHGFFNKNCLDKFSGYCSDNFLKKIIISNSCSRVDDYKRKYLFIQVLDSTEILSNHIKNTLRL